MKSIEVKGTARTIAERSSEQARALKEIRKNGGVPCVLYGGNEVVHFTVTNEGLRNLIYTPHQSDYIEMKKWLQNDCIGGQNALNF